MKKRSAIVILAGLALLLSAADSQARRGRCGKRGMIAVQDGWATATPLFSTAGHCRSCHDLLWDDTGLSVSVFRDWAPTMMAQAGRDPLWQAKVHTETLRNPENSARIQELCSRCHTPMAATERRNTAEDPALFETGVLTHANPLYPMAIDGVSCAICHQILESGLGLPGSFSGNYRIDDRTPRPERPVYGRYPFPFPMPMRRMAGFTPRFSDHMDRSELCATCHTLMVPLFDANGVGAGMFPEQTPYLEWRESRFGDGKDGDDRSCQQCHMPEAFGAVVISTMGHRHTGPRYPFARHHFVGGNAFMLALMDTYWEMMDLPVPDRRFDLSLSRVRNQLSDRTADIQITAVEIQEDRLFVATRVSNRTGHKCPTGVPARRAWIHLKTTDAEGRVVFESGRPQTDGAIEGNAADNNLLAFEPHYNRIVSSNQVQIYESIMGDAKGAVTYAFTRSENYLKDNRLLPAGFLKSASAAAVSPHGAAAEDPDFKGGEDLVVYEIPIGGYTAPFRIDATLFYQSVGSAFVRDLLQFEPDSVYVARFADLYRRTDKAPVVLARVEHIVNL